MSAIEKSLTFDMLTNSEKEIYLGLLEKVRMQKTDAQLADEYYEKAGDLGKAIITAGTSVIKNRAISLFYAFRDGGIIPGTNKRLKLKGKMLSYLYELASRYDCNRLDLNSFPGWND